MRKRLITLLTLFSIGLVGCSNSNSEELTKEDQEAIYREEVQRKLDEEEAERSKIEERETVSKETVEEEADEVETNESETEEVETDEKSPEDKFASLPVGTQASVISTYYDERATANSLVNEGMYTAYSFENHRLIIMVTSGAGSGHPIYLLERQNDTYVPVDGVVYVGADSVESATPPQLEITLSELYEEYLLNESLYDQANDTAYNMEMTIEDFNSIKNNIGQVSENDETQTTTPVEDEVVGTVNGVTNTINSFYSIGGSVGVEFSIYNGSSNQIEYSPYDIQLYKDNELLPINDIGESGVLAPGETGTSYILFNFMGFEPYLLEWNSLQITITPVVS